jgi:hypothetical protein
MGGTGAAGVVALALLLGGFGTPLASSPDAAVPHSKLGVDGGQLPATTPGQAQPTIGSNLAGSAPEKVTDTVYVMPAPTGDPDRNNEGNQPADPRPSRDNDNADDNDGDSEAADDQGDDEGDDADEADDADESHDSDHSDDGNEPGDD